MRRGVGVLLAVVALAGCGSPEQYQKQGVEADTSTVSLAVGFDVGDPYRPWAKEFILAMGQSRLRYDEGNLPLALHISDSLINSAELAIDSIGLGDVRSKFLLIMLTDLYTQTITWQELRGDTINAQVRTAKFQRLADRVRDMRDSIDRVPQ